MLCLRVMNVSLQYLFHPSPTDSKFSGWPQINTSWSYVYTVDGQLNFWLRFRYPPFWFPNLTDILLPACWSEIWTVSTHSRSAGQPPCNGSVNDIATGKGYYLQANDAVMNSQLWASGWPDSQSHRVAVSACKRRRIKSWIKGNSRLSYGRKHM